MFSCNWLYVVLAAVTYAGNASAGTFYAINAADHSLVRIDPATAAITVVGSTGVTSGQFGDLSYNPADGELYWVAGRDNNSLYTIDPGTGQATLVGSHGINDLFALAWDTTHGVLYGDAADGNLYTIDPTTAAATLVGFNEVYPGGLAYVAATDSLYLLHSGNDNLYLVNRTNGGVATAGGGAFYVNDNAIAWDPETNSFWVSSWNQELYRYDSTFSSQTALSLGFKPDGLAFVPGGTAIPEPASLGLAAAGLLLVGFFRRRARA